MSFKLDIFACEFWSCARSFVSFIPGVLAIASKLDVVHRSPEPQPVELGDGSSGVQVVPVHQPAFQGKWHLLHCTSMVLVTLVSSIMIMLARGLVSNALQGTCASDAVAKIAIVNAIAIDAMIRFIASSSWASYAARR